MRHYFILHVFKAVQASVSCNGTHVPSLPTHLNPIANERRHVAILLVVS
jgi:hypothetical protein